MPQETSLWRRGWQEPLAGLRRQLPPFHGILNQACWLWRIAMRWRPFDVCQKKSAFTAITASALTESHVCTSWPLVPSIRSRTLIILQIRLRWCRVNVYWPNIWPFRIYPPHKMCSLSWFCCHVLCSKPKYSWAMSLATKRQVGLIEIQIGSAAHFRWILSFLCRSTLALLGWVSSLHPIKLVNFRPGLG